MSRLSGLRQRLLLPEWPAVARNGDVRGPELQKALAGEPRWLDYREYVLPWL